jgi:hypothetical protein
MCNAWDTTPSDGQPEIEPNAKVLSIGSFCPEWDAERKARNAQQQLAHDLAMVGIHSSDAGKPDDKGAA